MPVPAEGDGWDVPSPDIESAASRDVALKRLKSDPGRFGLLMIDNATGKATRVDFRPLTLEMILRSSRRDRPMLIGYLLLSLVDAARRLWPDFEPATADEPRTTLNGYPLEPREVPKTSFLPRWRRRQKGDE